MKMAMPWASASFITGKLHDALIEAGAPAETAPTKRGLIQP
jgi:hypothetical protein